MLAVVETIEAAIFFDKNIFPFLISIVVTYR